MQRTLILFVVLALVLPTQSSSALQDDNDWSITTDDFTLELYGAVKSRSFSVDYDLPRIGSAYSWLVVTYQLENTTTNSGPIRSGWIRLLSHGQAKEQEGDASRSLAAAIEFKTLTRDLEPGERVKVVQVFQVMEKDTDFTLQESYNGEHYLSLSPVIQATDGYGRAIVPVASDGFDISRLDGAEVAQVVPTPPPTPTPTPTPPPTPTPEPTFTPEPTATSAPPVRRIGSCADFDAWEWAQAVFDINPQAYAVLDADGDGVACPELPRNGFAPAFWMEAIPDNLEVATIIRVVDGDTLELQVDGTTKLVSLYRADAPETQAEPQCGGQQAADFTAWVLSWNSTPGVVYFERDLYLRDQSGDELAYIWFESGGLPYLVNHVLINNGWATDVQSGDHKYDQQLKDAAGFAERHQLGVYAQCGGFGQPLPTVVPTAASTVEPTAAPADVPPVADTSGSQMSGGLGLSPAEWVAEHGKGTPSETKFGLIYEGRYDVVGPPEGNVISIGMNFADPGVPIELARYQAQLFMPYDAVLIDQYTSPLGSRVDLYYSDWLVSRVDSTAFGGQPGEFIVIYRDSDEDGNPNRAFIIIGNNP